MNAFVVEITVQVVKSDRARLSRVAARMAGILPAGSQVLETLPAMDSPDGLGHLRWRVPATGQGTAGALSTVATALELALFPEGCAPVLGRWCSAVVERQNYEDQDEEGKV